MLGKQETPEEAEKRAKTAKKRREKNAQKKKLAQTAYALTTSIVEPGGSEGGRSSDEASR